MTTATDGQMALPCRALAMPAAPSRALLEETRDAQKCSRAFTEVDAATE